ncbi:glycoside hydrolase family 89 protein [Serpula lacrymans var. lacrymans S7.3]|uniref:Glycoside hydrolase family 89 protein n=2 Tax=Serpula lacrymans var. lacrymans TaxID=341189 RepID=F8PTW7_SERL3|nr:glycoside hydrolase family 89 protein [Serpula lacrymans var. lacrymans S7.9]EGN99592.1 glycoside hydrolase family 89 protein [Serpula lacrymans var. lacrymans S7.3]EGO25161.1 glycoside hydrolase family 89 protein [Serpula lacrymans var. lacrymans S7.9]
MMLFGFVGLAVAVVANVAGAAAASSQLEGLYSLVKRQIPAHAGAFTFELSAANTTNATDTFTLSDIGKNATGNATILIECSTISACARGLYTYVTEFGGVDIWWTGSRLNELPSQLPEIGEPVTRTSLVPYRYHFNTVTFSYTASFYDFDDWSFLLDWLALRGVNLPLAWVGNEYVLVQVFREAGLTDADIATFLSGPAFQAWNRFGNIQGSWGGDLPEQWINDQFVLQKQILARMVELGMTPVLPSFTGFVPRAMHTLYPNASIVNGSQWSTFTIQHTNDSFLEPFDPLFSTLQTSFMTKYAAAYGNVSHIYTLDQYNEMMPYSGNTSYLSSISSATFASLRATDPEAVWMMQGWLFYIYASFWTDERVEAYLGGVPGNDSMIILDLFSEAYPQWQRLNSYFGKQWIWCELHDFGGNMGFEGNFENVTTQPVKALATPGNTMVGMGLTMEGQEGNEIMYDVLFDQAWSPTPINRTSYVSAWTSRRYNVPNLPTAATEAWEILASTVYNNQDPLLQATIKSIFELEPAINGLVNLTVLQGIPTGLFYDTNTTIVPALQSLLQARQESSALDEVPEFQYDVVYIIRQLLANRFIDLYTSLVDTYNSTTSSSSDVSTAGAPLITLLKDVDSVLLTDTHFLLSNWISAARNWAHDNSTYAAYLEYNARNQITLWGPRGEVHDYASKQWGGLVGTYYVQRWEEFVSYLSGSKANGTAYNGTAVADVMFNIGLAWDNETWGQAANETWGTVGNTWDVVQQLVDKYI